MLKYAAANVLLLTNPSMFIKRAVADTNMIDSLSNQLLAKLAMGSVAMFIPGELQASISSSLKKRLVKYLSSVEGKAAQKLIHGINFQYSPKQIAKIGDGIFSNSKRIAA